MDRIRVPASFDASKLSKVSAADYSSSESGEEEDDYLMPSTNPNANEFADFNPRKRRRTGRDPKESAALGIFGSESEDDGPGKRWKRKTLRGKGVSFVSSISKPKDSGDEDDEDENEEMDIDEDGEPTMKGHIVEDDEEAEEEEEEASHVGLGFRPAAGQGLGWAPPSQKPSSFVKSSSTPQKPFMKTKFDGSTPLGRGFMPTSANEPVLKVRDDDSPTPPPIARPSAFSTSTKQGKTKANPNSFGARMMAKMGYKEGQGLGKEGQGRNLIIEATLRPQGVGLGAIKEKTEKERQEEKRRARLRGEVVVDSDEEEKKKRAARKKKALASGISSGAGSGTSTPKRQKPKYLTLDEARKAAPGLNIPDAFTPILDLTGPGKKMLTSSSGLMTPTGGVAMESVEASESRKLARRAQSDFVAILEEWQSLQERKAYIELQLKQEQQELEELVAGVKANLLISVSCDGLSQSAQNGMQDHASESNQGWDRVISVLKTASDAISEAVLPAVADELASIAVGAIHPVFKAVMQHWSPLEDPKPRYADDLRSLSGILGVRAVPKHRHKPTATPYETMMYKLWLPRVASAVREWNVRDSDQMLAVFEAWEDLLPDFVRLQLLEREIARKLDEAVQKWEPKRKKHHNLPHIWIFPWLQHLPPHHLDPKSSTGLVAEVKRKFRQLVDVWDFGRGVIPGLIKWKDVLRPSKSNDQWRPLVMNHVLPGLARYLRNNFRVDPGDQEPYLEMLVAVFKWVEVLSTSMIGELMVAEVFPLWHDALYQWLVSDGVNYEEIALWLAWWAGEVFPQEIEELVSIAAEFQKGCRMINEALDLGDRAKAELRPPIKGPALEPRKSSPKASHNNHQRNAASAKPALQEPEEVTFRRVVEDWCEANDLQFIPERKKVHAEGPLYRITARGDGRGGVLAYFKWNKLCVETKKGVVEIREDHEADWSRLLEMAH